MAAQSPLLGDVDRVSSPKHWTRSNITLGQAAQWGLAETPSGGNAMHSYNLALHHNVPWKTLRDSWDVIVTFCSEAVIRDVFKLYNYGCAMRRPDRFEDKLAMIREAVGPGPKNAAGATYERWMQRMSEQMENLSPEKQIDTDEGSELINIVIWQQWNILEGPKENLRTDDPGSDGFDDFRCLGRTNYSRFERARLYYNALKTLVDEYKKVKAGFCSQTVLDTWTSIMSQALDQSRTLRQETLLSFDNQSWERVNPAPRGKPAMPNCGGDDYKKMHWVKRKQVIVVGD